MNSIKRAMKYLLNKKSKSTILIILFTVLISTVLIGFIIDDTINAYYNKIDNKNGIEVNLINFRNSKDIELKKDTFDTILNKDYVTDYRQDFLVQSKDQSIKLLDLSQKEPEDDSGSTGGMIMAQAGSSENGAEIIGTTHLSLYPTVIGGDIVLKNNKTDLANNEVIISEELAKENNLLIGDTFTLTDNKNNVITATIVDTFTTTGQYGYLQGNSIYSNADMARKFNIDDTENSLGFLTIYIKNVADYEELKKDIYALDGLSEENMMLNLSDELYNQVISPLETTQSFVKIATIIIGIITILILGVILTLMIKERYYEIGVLYSLGASKNSIISQFIFENIILVTIAFTISIILAMNIGIYIIDLVTVTDQFQSLNGNVGIVTSGKVSGENKMEIEAIFKMASLLKGYVLNVAVITFINLVVLCKVLLKKPREILIKE